MRPIVLALILVATAVNPPTLLAAQQETGQTAQARRLLIEASHLVKDIPEFQQPSAASNIAGQLVRAADLPGALATVKLLEKPEDQAQATGIVAWQLAHDSNFTQALALVESTVDGQNKGVAYENLAQTRAEKGDLDGALQIAHHIRSDPGRLVDTLVRLASRAAKSGNLSGARETLGDALQVTEEAIKENVGYATGLTQIATTQAEIGDTADAFITLDRFSAIADRYKGAGRNGMFLPELSCAQAQIGDLVGAQRTSAEIPAGTGTSDFALMCISREQAKHGLMIEALDNAARISSPTFKGNTLQEIGMIRGTRGALNDVLEAIDHISQPNDRAEALATLALEQAENEDPAAGSTLQMAWKLATEIGKDASDNVLGTIAVTRALLGDFVVAQQIVQGMTKPESRVWPLWNITSFMVRAGHTQEALALAENQDAAYPKAYALLGAAQGILNRLESEEQARTGKH